MALDVCFFDVFA
ncbi:hypothetical protein DDN44_18090 [Vibrio cholerae]|nr:hypothetical protein [Vibrio cholerae]